MITERPCWGPAGSSSKCYSAICSNRLNSCPFVHFEQTAHTCREPALGARTLQSGCGFCSQGHFVLSALRSRLCPRHGWAGSAASSPGLELPHPMGSVESDELLPEDARGGCGCFCSTWPHLHPAAEPHATTLHSPWYAGFSSTEFNTTTLPGIREPRPWLDLPF